MTWLDDLEAGELKHWLRNTSIPMLAGMPDGKILWCNEACEVMTGYTIFELIRSDWRQLTDGPDDLAADIEAAKEVELGSRKEYRISKAYRTKHGPSRRVVIHVLRNPLEGPFKCCLVSIYPFDANNEITLETLEKVRKQQEKVVELLTTPRPNWLSHYIEAFKKYPTQTIMATVSVLAFIFGNRVLEIVAAVQRLFHNGSVPP